jgi:hypothetical protein
MRARRLGAVLTLVLPMIGMMGTWSVPQNTSPELSISLSSGADAVAEGDEITYLAEIDNRGAPVAARVVLTPPAYIEMDAAAGGLLEDDGLVWDLTLESGMTPLSVSALVGEIPAGELRATAVISVYVDGSTTPLVRTAVADHIEGVDDEQVTVTPVPRLLAVGGLFVLLASGATGAVAVLIRRRHPVHDADADAGSGQREPLNSTVD